MWPLENLRFLLLLKLCQMPRIWTHCTWLKLFSTLVEGTQDRDGIFPWICAPSHCRLCSPQRPSPWLLHVAASTHPSPVASRCPARSSRKTTQHQGIWLLLYSPKRRSESSFIWGSQCTPLYPKCTFCFLFLSCSAVSIIVGDS